MTDLQNGAVRAAQGVGLGMFVVRAAMAHGLTDILLAGGVTGFELGIVKAIEAKARSVEAENEEIRKAEGAHQFAEAARGELERRQAIVKSIEERKTAILDEIEMRSLVPEPETEKRRALAELRAGYMAGIAANRARGIAPAKEGR